MYIVGLGVVKVDSTLGCMLKIADLQACVSQLPFSACKKDITNDFSSSSTGSFLR